MKLVIVESPAKCTTIKRYLGENFDVRASLGHVCDLATTGKGGLGVDIEAGFTPSYIINKDKIRVVHELQNAAKKADEVILATDPDREGEAIAWHLSRVLNLNQKTTKRLEFHEITRDSINDAINHPRTIDIDLVASQETRRILDRIIGFKLSTLIYKRIRSRSAGRVQSAALKIIYDREKEIEEFVPEEYWNILSSIKINDKDVNLSFLDKNGKPIEIHNEKEAQEIINSIPDKLKVIDIKTDIRLTESKEPFTTSTLQQEAFNRLKFKTKKTQFVAQTLYEGIDVGDEHMGLITYMRTDSTRLSPTFVARATNYIIETFGKEYVGRVKGGKLNEMSQDAHEAIRPTSNHRVPDSVKQYLSADQYALYKLIYNRAVASLMKPKKEEVLVVTLSGGEYLFKFEFSHTIFKGYSILLSDLDDKKDYYGKFPKINIGDTFDIVKKEGEQKFTQPPAHYSEAKMVKTMEEVGIGRPSTYASTIEILRSRKYVNNNGGILTITDQGKKTIHVLDKYFPDITDIKYTAQMEHNLDNVQDGTESRIGVLSDFYNSFSKELKIANEKMYADELEKTGQLCPKCGSPLVYKDGKNGKFIGCSNYPHCRYVLKEPKKPVVETGDVCPKCGKPLVERTDKDGKTFIACSGYPKCRYIQQQPIKEIDESQYVKKCPKCGGYLIKKKGPYGTFLGCTNYPKCNYMEKISKKKRK